MSLFNLNMYTTAEHQRKELGKTPTPVYFTPMNFTRSHLGLNPDLCGVMPASIRLNYVHTNKHHKLTYYTFLNMHVVLEMKAYDME
jgi:hypothetical protein